MMILAHSALGWFDELIFLGIIVVFAGMMLIGWFRSRGDDFETDLMPEKPDSTDSDSPERFELD